jgi:CubicO group peptidase (beta-lactamase class C family)
LPYYGYFGDELWDLQTLKSNKDVLDVLVNTKPELNFPPNTKFTYCNTNFVILALIIEKITQKKFPIAMEELLFKPLKMNHSFIADELSDVNELTPSYNSTMKMQDFTYLDGTYGDKNLYTTARDLMRMDLGSYNPAFISDSLKKQMFTPYSNEKKGKYNYGLGIRMKEEAQKNTYYFHTGWWHGNTSLYCTLRNDTVCIVALSNVYDRRVYQFSKLSPFFGNYPFQVEEY